VPARAAIFCLRYACSCLAPSSVVASFAAAIWGSAAAFAFLRCRHVFCCQREMPRCQRSSASTRACPALRAFEPRRYFRLFFAILRARYAMLRRFFSLICLSFFAAGQRHATARTCCLPPLLAARGSCLPLFSARLPASSPSLLPPCWCFAG